MNGYKIENGVISYDEFDLIKSKQGVDTRLNKTCKKNLPTQVSDAQLDLLIETYLFAYVSSKTFHQTDLLSALLELKARRSS